MITQVSIKDLRGIAEGTVSGLTPLTILTGVNGSGKSTVLDALFIGAAPSPAEAVGRAVARRASRQSTAQWLFHKQTPSGSIEVSYATESASIVRRSSMKWFGRDTALAMTAFRNISSSIRPVERVNWLGGVELISARALPPTVIAKSTTLFADDDSYEAVDSDLDVSVLDVLRHVQLVDMRGIAGDERELTEVLSNAKLAGFVASTVDLLANIVPGIKNLEILKVGSGYDVGVIYSDGAVPLSMAGDGIRAVARLALELAALPNGVALLEEPEVHQHPGALKQSATTIVAAVQRGLQVVVATHSLELIDELLLSASKSDLLDKLSVQKLKLTNGHLEATLFEGPESDRIRNVIGTELR